MDEIQQAPQIIQVTQWRFRQQIPVFQGFEGRDFGERVLPFHADANYLIVFVTVVCRLFFMFCVASKQDFQLEQPAAWEVEELSPCLYVGAFAMKRVVNHRHAVRAFIP